MHDYYCTNVITCGNFALPNSDLCQDCAEREQAKQQRRSDFEPERKIQRIYDRLTSKPSRKHHERKAGV